MPNVDSLRMPALSPGDCAVLACLWEVAAAKPGNVYRGADFEDVTFADFTLSAVAIRQAMDRAPDAGVGTTVLQAIRSTQAAVRSNTNLGMVLLLAPLAAVPAGAPLDQGLPQILSRLTIDDARLTYEAIRLANPGGLGKVDRGDVRDAATPDLSLREAMALAADRDLVARQYVADYADVRQMAAHIAERAQYEPLEDAIVHGYLALLSRCPDTLIARKCGIEVASEASRRAALVLASGQPRDDRYQGALGDLDFWLRSDGHRRNPGATADVTAAALYVLLREGRIPWPATFYGPAA